jgi:hypothetical protein
MKFIVVTALLSSGFLLQFDATAADKEADSKEALQALQDYIGGWKGNGTSDKDRSEIWKETANWGWRFKGNNAALVVEMKQGKLFKAGTLRYLPAKEKYQLTLVDKNDKTQVYEGDLKKGTLTLDGPDPDGKSMRRIKVNTAGGGIRLVWTLYNKPENRTVYNKQFQISYTKEGESFGATAKKNECVVTGGLGTMTVSYMGQTYYVCCSGCRDAFNENPAKIIKEYLARKKRGE